MGNSDLAKVLQEIDPKYRSLAERAIHQSMQKNPKGMGGIGDPRGFNQSGSYNEFSMIASRAIRLAQEQELQQRRGRGGLANY